MSKEHQRLKTIFPWLRPCDPHEERQALFEKKIEILWDKVVVYEKFSEEEKSLRTRAVNALRKHEE
jgi:hypothetical protein